MASRIRLQRLFFGILPVLFLFLSNISIAQRETKTTDLLRLSEDFALKLQEHRPQLYNDLLASTDSVQARLNNDSNIKLMYIDDRGKPVYYILENINAAATISTDDTWPGGSGGFSLTGTGTAVGKLGIWDAGGVLSTHQELSGRVTQIDSPGSTHYHSTHVGGTMIGAGVQAAARGMSYQAILTAYDWNNDNAEMSSAAAAGMNISNHSYGLITGWYSSGSWYWYGDITLSTTEDYGFGYYSSDAQAWDQIAYNAPYYTIVKSAGNDRNDAGPGPGGGHYVWNGGWVWSTDTREIDGGTDGYDCISYAGTAKNIITVGAVDDIAGGYSVPADVVMSVFSGWGPVDDGRIKPDLVANGIGLYSSMDANNSDYGSLSGTSMSSPNLSGSLNLLVRHYEATHGGSTPRASTMKAVLIQTADEAGPSTGPDYMFGWGLMNTLKAAQMIQQDSLSTGIILEDSLGNTDTLRYDFYSDGSAPLRFTLAWIDPAGTSPAPSLNPTTLMLVNDLDMRLEHIGTGTIYYPYILNPAIPSNAASSGDNFRDNIEQVNVVSPSAGNYRLSISHKGTLSAPQYFSLTGSADLQMPTIGTPPVALCTNIVVSADSNCTANASIDNGSYDPDGDPITLAQIPPGPYLPGQTSVSLVVTDSSGLADTCQATVTVIDLTPPVLVCPAETSVNNDPGTCGAVVNFNINATDNCSSVNIISNPPSGGTFPIGINSVEVVASDSSGNADTCYFNITVNDTEPPVAICPIDTVVNSDSGQCDAIVNFSVSATDNCPGVIVNSNPPSGSLFPAGITQVEVVASDASGNADTCYFNVTVIDNEPPVAICPLDTTVGNDPGLCSAVVSFTATGTDNCLGVIVSTNPVSGSVFPKGVTSVEVVAADSSGNADTCYFNITVIDTEPPAAICPIDTLVNSDSGQCDAVVAFSIGATDNCPGVIVNSNPPSGSLFPAGITQVEVVASDSSGNADTCYFNVTVNDNEPPVLSCPVDTAVSNDPGQCGAIVSFTANATDNCSAVTVISNPPSGSLFPIGITTVEVIATDGPGNADTCYFNITVIDNEQPVAICPIDTTVGNDPGLCSAVVSFIASGSDNCSGVIVSTNPVSGSVFPMGITSVEVVATDSPGNADTCYFNVTVNDTEPPVAICLADTVVNSDSGQCDAVVNFSVGATDNCPGVIVNSNPPSGSLFPAGLTQVEVVASDSSGNADTCYFNVTVNDNEPPVVSCPADTVVNNDPGQCGAIVSFTTNATDNCSGVTVVSNPPSGGLFPIGLSSVEVVATDGFGNADTCYFNITVIDNEPPVAICPFDITVGNDPGLCGAAVSFTASGNDNCSGVMVSTTPASGSVFPLGLTPVEVVAADVSGNADTCYFNVTVNDIEPPVVICPADTVAEAAVGQCSTTVSFALNAADNCPGVIASSNPLSGSSFGAGTTPVMVVASDSSGNSDTCYFNVTVHESEPPVLICPADTVVENDPGDCGAVVNFTATAVDNCGSTNIMSNPASGSLFPVGVTSVRVIASDISGNRDTCYFNITVNDTEPPAAACPADTAVDIQPGQCGALVSFTVGASDNCSISNVSANPPSGSTFNVGTTPVEVIATDNTGNTDTCVFNITVIDNEPPVIICRTDTALVNEPGSCGASVSFTLNALDNCPGVIVYSEPPSGSFFPIGSTYVRAVAADSSGNADTCLFFVSVYDNEPPSAGCTGDQIVGNDPGECGAIANYNLNASDNCPGFRLITNPPQGTFLGLGVTPVRAIAIDGFGNRDTCYFNMIVNDTEPPVAICPGDTVVDNDPGQCGAIVTFVIDATDNCSVADVSANPQSGSLFPVGINVVTVIAADSTGNADTCFFNVVVNDTEAPTLSCPADTALYNDPGLCGAIVVFTPTAVDNCPGVIVTSNPPSGSFFSMDTTEVMVVAADGSGNADTCYFNVVVNDADPPVIACPANIFAPNDSGQCGAIVSYTVSATDNCAGVSISSNPPSGSFFLVGTTSVTAIAEDISGFADTCTFEINISDGENPTALCPADTVVYVSTGNDSAFVVFDLQVYDNCDSATISANPPSNSMFGLGITPVEVIASDPAGNADTCYFNITVEQTLITGVLEGTVSNMIGGPIQGVIVELVGYSISDTTDILGGYSFDSLGAGNYEIVSFSHVDYESLSVFNIPVIPADTTILNVNLIELPGLLFGIVVDTSGAFLEGVKVTLNSNLILSSNETNGAAELLLSTDIRNDHHSEFTDLVIDSTYTDINGYFEFTIDAGTYSCSLSHEDFYSLETPDTSVTPGDTTQLNIIMTTLPGYLEGTVTNISGDSVGGAIVELVGISRSDTTDPFGHYLFDNLAVDSIDVLFSHLHYQPYSASGIPITPGDTTRLDVTLGNLPGYLTGYVINQNLAPVESVEVIIEPDTSQFPELGRAKSKEAGNTGGVLLDTVEVVYTDINGYYEIVLPDSIYQAKYVHPECQDTTVFGIVVTPEDTIQVNVILICGCIYVVGDVNASGSFNGLDVTYGVNFFKGGSDPLCEVCPLCADWWYCGDVNGSCGYNGLDITYGVGYLKGGADPVPCADCPPPGGAASTNKNKNKSSDSINASGD